MRCDNTIHLAIELIVLSWLVAARLPSDNKARLHHFEGVTQQRCWH